MLPNSIWFIDFYSEIINIELSDLNALGFAGAAGSESHHAVAHELGLIELDELEDPGRVVDQPHLLHLHNSS